MKHKIAIVDTGIDLKNLAIEKYNINVKGVFCYYDSDNNIDCITTKINPYCIQDNVGHGTAMLNIMISHNIDVDFFIVKIYSSEDDFVDEVLLTYALEYIYNFTDCDIVNLSLGISILQDYEALYNICSKFQRDGRIIVAAFDNSGGISFPAEFDNVMGISSFDEGSKNEYYLVQNSPVNVLAYGHSQRIVWLDNSLLFGYGNSYACAHFSGILSSYQKSFSGDELKQWIALRSKQVIDFKASAAPIQNPVTNYKRAVAFPFNKEIHSLVRFSDLLNFELVDIYDTKYSARISANTDILLNEKCPQNYTIKNINDINWDAFDTFILGHTDEYFAAINMAEYKKKLVAEILERGKYLYSLDDIDYCLPRGVDKSKVFYPSVKKENVPNDSFGKLYRYDIPVVGIFGTSSKQGKFTLQLKLRRKFLDNNYIITQIGTEPTALLYGMDTVFPVGYNSTVKIDRHEVIRFLNRQIWKISRKSDVILVGGQSGIIPRDSCNTNYFNFTALELLYATMPDAIILLVNFSDSTELIERTINFVEAATRGKVIAIVVFPTSYKTQQKAHVSELLEFIKSKLSVPTYLLSDEKHMQELFKSIISFFSDI